MINYAQFKFLNNRRSSKFIPSLSFLKKYISGRVVSMEKIVIIGSAGAGKSTLARKLSSKLSIKVVHLDRVFWKPGWKEKPRDTRIDILQQIVREDQWVIEGTYLSSSEPRLNAADTIVFLDINPLLCILRIIRRYRPFFRLLRIVKLQHGYQDCSRRDIPDGCQDKLNLIRILKVLAFPFRGRRTLKQKLRKYKSKQIIWLRSPREVEDFLAQLEPHADEKRQSSKTPTIAGNRQLASQNGNQDILTKVTTRTILSPTQ